MAITQQSYVGKGAVYVGLRAGGILRFVGQVPEFKLNVTEEVKEMRDNIVGGGLADSVSFITKVEAALTLESLSAKNLALALRGVGSATTSSVKTNQANVAYAGGLTPLDGVAPSSVTVTVAPNAHATTTAYTVGQIVKPATGTHFYKCKTAGTSDVTAPTWKTDGTDTTDGTVMWTDMGTMALSAGDYNISAAGVTFPEDSAKVDESGTPITVSYTSTAGTLIQALADNNNEYRIVFSGSNYARNGAPMKIDIFRAKFSPTKDLDLIGSDFAKLAVTANVLADDTKSGIGISSFATIEMVEG